MNRTVRHPIETLRTAPVYFSGVAINLSMAALNVNTASELGSRPESALQWAAASVNAGAIAMNLMMAQGKLDLRDRLESQLTRYGFNERAMITTTQAYCARQAAIVACENTGYSNEYAVLCEQNPGMFTFNCLPKI